MANAALFDVPPSVSILLGKSPNGTFQNAVDYNAGISPRSVVVGDFNGDGKPDLAVADYGQIAGSSTTNSFVQVLLGKGDGTFSNAVSYVAGAGPISIAVGDFDTNAILDLVVANERSTNISVLIGNGNGTFQTARNFNAGMHPHSVAVGDFNGDNKPDVAVVNDDGVFLLLNSCLILADLAITQTDNPDPIGAGLNLTYTLSVTNSGPVTTPDVSITDPLPAGLVFVSATPSQGSCTNIGGTVNCSFGLMTNGAQASVTITATTTIATTITNTATVTSFATTDPNSANNTAKITTTVLPRVSLAATDPSASETGPDAGVFTVSRAGGTAGPLTVNYTVGGTASNGVDYTTLSGSVTISNGTATAGTDYLPTNGIAIFAPGTTNQTLAVTILGDVLNEADDTFFVNLSNPTNGIIGDSQGVGTISNDDPLPILSIGDVTVTEGDSGASQAVFAINLSVVSGRALSVNFATANGTAVAGSDYVATNGTLTFSAGTTIRPSR